MIAGVVVVSLLALAALVYVTAPIRRGPRSQELDGSRLASEAEARKRAALAAIVDLEADHAVGKLSTEDLDALRRDYETQALDALHELDALGSTSQPLDPLEAEIASIREEIECPSCGAPRARGTTCARCGS